MMQWNVATSLILLGLSLSVAVLTIIGEAIRQAAARSTATKLGEKPRIQPSNGLQQLWLWCVVGSAVATAWLVISLVIYVLSLVF